MNSLQRLTSYLLVLFLITACSSDDDENPGIDNDLIIGTWLLVSDVDQDGVEYIQEGDCNYFLTFTANTIDGSEYYGENCDELDPSNPIPYTLENDILTFNEDGDIFSLQVVVLNDTTLQIRYEYEDEGEMFFDITTFTRQ